MLIEKGLVKDQEGIGRVLVEIRLWDLQPVPPYPQVLKVLNRHLQGYDNFSWNFKAVDEVELIKLKPPSSLHQLFFLFNCFNEIKSNSFCNSFFVSSSVPMQTHLSTQFSSKTNKP